jgi:probable rRNA maturation factor
MHRFSEVNFLDIDENSEYIELIEKVIRQAFLEEEIDNICLYINVILTNPDNIRKINKEYRSIDKETDVLSFPMFEKEEIETMKQKGNDIEEALGDIVISIEKVKEQSKDYGHSFERELSYMLIHGFYHLMGCDHIEEDDKIKMREKEEKVLNKLQITR